MTATHDSLSMVCTRDIRSLSSTCNRTADEGESSMFVCDRIVEASLNYVVS